MTGKDKMIGVYPSAAHSARRRLFAALEETYPVRFLPSDARSTEGLDAWLELRPQMMLSAHGSLPLDIPSLIMAEDGSHGARSISVKFRNADALDGRLRGRTLRDDRSGGCPPLAPTQAEIILADFDDGPGWTKDSSASAAVDRIAAPLAELGPQEGLSHRLRAGDFLSLLPLIHWLRELTPTTEWRTPPLRAAFLFDDPNLHASSFGFINFSEIAAHAVRHNYHAAMATVPLDAWLVRDSAVRIFRENRAYLSLLVHGNDHVRHELGHPRSDAAARRLLAQAQRRIARLEHRSGLSVSRVMAAPHGRCTEVVMRQLPLVGFEAACISRSYPWLPRPPASNPLAEWRPADVVAGGATVITRLHIASPRDEIVLRAFLGRPLVVYGHHQDLNQGLDILADWADLINSLGNVQWGALEEFARSSYLWRQDGEVLHLRPLARRLRFVPPAGVRWIRVETSTCWPQSEYTDVILNRRQKPFHPNSLFDVSHLEIGEPIDLTLPHRSTCDAHAVPAPPLAVWPVVRRLLTEGRDRLQPLSV